MGVKCGSYKRFRKKFLKAKSEEGKQYCHYCGVELVFGIHPIVNESATIDHVKPLSKGGALKDVDNLVLSCYKCNCDKGDSYE